MDKKLQIFISSTYTDLIEERQAVVETILQCGHIPAGMELFSANNKKQFDVIKKWIRNSDLVILILGGKYGSLEQEKNKSYIQLEYEYAKHIGKTPIVLVLTDEGISNKIRNGLYDFNVPEHLNPQYIEFKSMILKSKLCAFFSDIDDLKVKVMNVIKEQEIELRNKNIGWVKIGDVSNIMFRKPERMCEYDEQGYEYKDLENGIYVNKIFLRSNINELRYYTGKYTWVYGGSVNFQSYYDTQKVVDVYRENLDYVVTNRLNQVIEFGDTIQTGVMANITNCESLYHMHLHYRLSQNSTLKRIKMWVKIPKEYIFTSVTYSIYDILKPSNPLLKKSIDCRNKNYIEKPIDNAEKGKEYYLTWDILKL